jgi:flagellar basal body-associated protein FliL
MQRNIIVALAVLVLLLALALASVLLPRGESGSAPIAVNAADETAVEPYHQEMDCIDRLLQDNSLGANEVEPALARCQGGGSGTQGNAQ